MAILVSQEDALALVTCSNIEEEYVLDGAELERHETTIMNVALDALRVAESQHDPEKMRTIGHNLSIIQEKISSTGESSGCKCFLWRFNKHLEMHII